MRRKDKELESESVNEILSSGEYGILSTAGKNSQPYGVPLNYVYKENSIYFHCAEEGYKLDNIGDNPKVAFCVVGKTKIISQNFTTAYESVIAFGKAIEVKGNKKKNILLWLLEKYSPDFIDTGKIEIKKHYKAVKIIKIQISEKRGKISYKNKL